MLRVVLDPWRHHRRSHLAPRGPSASLAGRALATGLWEMEVRDIRDAATDKHRSVDDTPAHHDSPSPSIQPPAVVRLPDQISSSDFGAAGRLVSTPCSVYAELVSDPID